MSLNIDELRNEVKRLENDGGGDFLENFVKMPEGEGAVVVRLLPPAPAGMFDRDKSSFYVATRIIRINNKTLHSPNVLVGNRWKGDCPITKYYNWLWRQVDKATSPDEAEKLKSTARSIKPIERYYYNAIVRTQYNSQTNREEHNVGPKILSVGKTLHKMILRAIIGDEGLGEEPLGDVSDATSGRDFKIIKTIKKSGSDEFPEYSQSKFLNASPLGDPDQVSEWMQNLHDLQALRVIKSNEEMKRELQVHLGVVEDNGDDFDPTEFQRPSERRPSVTVNETPAANTTTVESAPKAPAPEQENVVPDSDDDEPMADDAFLNELRSI